MQKYFTTKKISGITIITFLFSDLSLEQGEELKEALYKLVSKEENKFVINMHKCTFLPSISLGIFITFNGKVNAKNGKVAFCAMPEQLKRIFVITNLDKVLKIYPSEEDAIKCLE